MLKEYYKGLLYVSEGIRIFCQRPGLWFYALIPFLFTCIIYALLTWGAIGVCQSFTAEVDSILPSWLGWVGGFFIYTVIFLLLLIMIAITSGTVYEVIGGGFFDRMLQKFAGPPPAERKISYGIAFCLQMILFGFNTLLLFFVGLILCVSIPFLGSVVAFFLMAYRFAIAYLSYTGLYTGMTFKEMKRFARKNLSAVLGYGSGVFLIMMIPILPVFFLPGVILVGYKLYSNYKS